MSTHYLNDRKFKSPASGGSQTHWLTIRRRVLYHCATTVAHESVLKRKNIRPSSQLKFRNNFSFFRDERGTQKFETSLIFQTFLTKQLVPGKSRFHQFFILRSRSIIDDDLFQKMIKLSTFSFR